MSRLENTTIRIKNSKISSETLQKICLCFSEDMTASQTAKQCGYSRQTINQYYKLFRMQLLHIQEQLEKKKMQELLEKYSLEVQYIQLYGENIFYLQVENKIIILDKEIIENESFKIFLTTQLMPQLINHKRANAARILYNKNTKHFLTSGYLCTQHSFDDFIQNRLKQFRGINHNNIHIHLKESQFRFNHQDNLYEHLLLCFK